ncbi:MAG: cytochrome c biogenesis protein CcdA [Anaerolineaceae bacterium]
MINVSLSLAFLAGLASFLTPCVFSLVPAYIGYLGGRSIAVAEKSDDRWEAFRHGLAFVLGFSLVFISMGIAASAVGGLLYDIRTWLAKIGGIVVVILGIHMTGLFRIPFLEYDLRPRTIPDRNRGYVSSLFLGIVFSAGWSPCVGPVLGAILTLAFNGGSILKGIQLLSAYSVGLAVPFLLAALGIGWVSIILKKYSKVMRITEIVMGAILIIVGVMLFLGTFEQIARFGYFVNFGL